MCSAHPGRARLGTTASSRRKLTATLYKAGWWASVSRPISNRPATGPALML